MVVARKRRGHCWNEMPGICAPLWRNCAPAGWRQSKRPVIFARLPLFKPRTRTHICCAAQTKAVSMAHAKTLERLHATASIPQLKPVEQVQKPPHGHWVGDGFPVRTIFAYDNAERVTPFLLMDYAGPSDFPASDTRRGVGEHPHRGFETVTPVGLWEIRLTGGRGAIVPVPPGHNVSLFVLRGTVNINGRTEAKPAEFVQFGSAGEAFRIDSDSDALVLVLSGEPIREPVFGYGPFVMNTEDEIRTAIADYRSGRMGHLK